MISHKVFETTYLKKWILGRPIFIRLSLVPIDWTRTSSWPRLLSIAARVLPFIDLLRNMEDEEERRMDPTLSIGELKAAESMVLKDLIR